jgi:hypothetical protein
MNWDKRYRVASRPSADTEGSISEPIQMFPKAESDRLNAECGRCGITLFGKTRKQNPLFGTVCKDCHDVINYTEE